MQSISVFKVKTRKAENPVGQDSFVVFSQSFFKKEFYNLHKKHFIVIGNFPKSKIIRP